ncbi:Drug/metabolite transporter [Cynara cardunculus var. scolymus]|uniref:WAT1-related protein n=1 Tax=Cynara cardunculus var. scolymus TaxID=59895 RepID=A0A124SEC7_CYNCS|nr:Drug/metabolite transporter [Cynara cardunculus var. scolymus]
MSSLKIVKAYEGYKPYIAMLLVQVIYAGMALLSKASISSGMNPSIFVVYRQAFATLSLAPLAYFFERKNVPQLSYTLMWKIFFSSLIGITICLNMYYHALNHTSATFAAATTNLVPAITFVIALILRIERMYIKELHGWVKLIGAIASLSGALVFAFVKGPTLNFMAWCTSGEGGEIASTMNQFSSKSDLIQAIVGAIAMERNLPSWKLGWDVNLLSVAYCKRGPVFTAMFTPLALIITAVVSMFLWKETLYFGSVCGAVLLAGGLYCVLWGKSREVESKISEVKPEEETTLESIKTQDQ